MHRGLDFLAQAYPLRPVIFLVTQIGDRNIGHEKKCEENPGNDTGYKEPADRRIRERSVN